MSEELARRLQAQFDQESHHCEAPDHTSEELARQLQAQYDQEAHSEVAQLLPEQFQTPQKWKPVSIISDEWETIDPTPEIHALFLQFNSKFFWNKLLSCEVKWSPNMMTCAGICSFSPWERFCTIALSLPLLKLRPRKDLVETLLHEMIHAYLFITDNNKDRDGHGPEFHKHMYRINNETGTNISVYHNFHDEVNLYKQRIAENRRKALKRKREAENRKKLGGSVVGRMSLGLSARDIVRMRWADKNGQTQERSSSGGVKKDIVDRSGGGESSSENSVKFKVGNESCSFQGDDLFQCHNCNKKFTKTQLNKHKNVCPAGPPPSNKKEVTVQDPFDDDEDDALLSVVIAQENSVNINISDDVRMISKNKKRDRDSDDESCIKKRPRLILDLSDDDDVLSASDDEDVLIKPFIGENVDEDMFNDHDDHDILCALCDNIDQDRSMTACHA